MTERVCARGGCTEPPLPRSKYCSDACRDTAQRAKKKARPAMLKGVARRAWRIYDYRPGPEP